MCLVEEYTRAMLNETITTLNHEGAVFRQVAHLKLFAIEKHCIRHQCKKITVLSCHRYLISTGIEKMNNI